MEKHYSRLGFQTFKPWAEAWDVDMEAIEALYTQAGLPTDWQPEQQDTTELAGFDISLEDAAIELLGDVPLQLERLANSDVVSAPEISIEGLHSGWQIINADGSTTLATLPENSLIIFDTETVNYEPVMATAYCEGQYYLWMHPWFNNSDVPYVKQLIDLPNGSTVITWNTAFDRSKVKLNKTHKWVDAMSLHQLVSGLASEQRFWYMEKVHRYVPAYANEGCLNNLKDAYKFYHDPEAEVDKAARNVFVKATHISDVAPEFCNVVPYAVEDVVMVAKLWANLWNKYKQGCPSLVTLSGLIIVAEHDLHVADDWHDWISDVEAEYESRKNKLETDLLALAEQVYQDWLAGEIEETSDVWFSQLDWTLNKTGKNKGLPKWLVQARKGLSLRSWMTPILMRVKYLDSAVVYDKKSKWNYLTENGIERIHHSTGEEDLNVGGIFGQTYLLYWERGDFTSAVEGTLAMVETAISLAFWTGYRERVKSVEFVD